MLWSRSHLLLCLEGALDQREYDQADTNSQILKYLSNSLVRTYIGAQTQVARNVARALPKRGKILPKMSSHHQFFSRSQRAKHEDGLSFYLLVAQSWYQKSFTSRRLTQLCFNGKSVGHSSSVWLFLCGQGGKTTSLKIRAMDKGKKE